MLLNCDLGEGNSDKGASDDAAVMPYLDQANIACGFHAGDPLTVHRTIHLALDHGVAIGAHPSYPDREGFGRRSMTLDEDTLIALLHYQISALDGMTKAAGTELAHIKPHGALYNDMMANEAQLITVMRAIATLPTPLPLVVQSTVHWEAHSQLAQHLGIELQFEVFADRRYLPDGALMPRSQPGAVLNHTEAVEQAQALAATREVRCADGSLLQLRTDTLCLHGDHPDAPANAARIRTLLQAH